MSQTLHLKSLKHLHYGGASCVHDQSMVEQVKRSIVRAVDQNCLNDDTIQNTFLDQYVSWVENSKLNKFQNLSKFDVKAFSNGTTEGFDKFYLKNHTRRFRCFRGEYMYHGATWKKDFSNWCYIDQAPLMSNDAVIVSLAFSDTGNIHQDLYSVLDQCDQLNIPVLIDCAFVGICANIEFDFDRPCITDITFSLSKTFPVANLRIGMRLTRVDDDDSLLVINKTNYTNRLSCAVGLDLISKYSADYNYKQWREQQVEFCKQLDIVPSNTVIFGLGDQRYQEYNRGNTTNRLCFARYLAQGTLPND